MLNSQRNAIAQYLSSNLPKNIFPQSSDIDSKRVYYYYVAYVSAGVNIGLLRGKLLRMGMDIGIKSEITDNCAVVYNNFHRYPVVNKIYNGNIQIPIYDNLSPKEASLIIDKLKSCLFQ